jgi:hypothetical protein
VIFSAGYTGIVMERNEIGKEYMEEKGLTGSVMLGKAAACRRGGRRREERQVGEVAAGSST